MTGSIAVSQCGHTPNRPGHHGTVVASTVGTVAISCNASEQTKLVASEPELDFTSTFVFTFSNFFSSTSEKSLEVKLSSDHHYEIKTI